MAGPAQILVNTLLGRGFTKTGIAHFFAIDPRTIGYAAAGERPASNLVPGLERLVGSGMGPKEAASNIGTIGIARRPQKVRQPAQKLGPATGKQATYTEIGSDRGVIKALENARDAGQKVQLTASFGNVKRSRTYGGKQGAPRPGAGKREEKGEVVAGQKGGLDPAQLLEQIHNPGPGDHWKPGQAGRWARAYMHDLAPSKAGQSVEHVGRFQRMSIYAFNPTP